MTAEPENNKKIQVEAYAGYRAGETPRSVVINGRKYDVNMIIYRKRVVQLDNYDEEEHFKLDLKGFGETDIIYKPRIDVWEIKKPVVPEKPFSEMI